MNRRPRLIYFFHLRAPRRGCFIDSDLFTVTASAAASRTNVKFYLARDECERFLRVHLRGYYIFGTLFSLRKVGEIFLSIAKYNGKQFGFTLKCIFKRHTFLAICRVR